MSYRSGWVQRRSSRLAELITAAWTKRRCIEAIGTPEQIADTLIEFGEAGIDGFNLVYSVTPGTFVDFIDGVVPILQERGHVPRHYEDGPLRQRLFGSPRLPERHPAAAYRHRQPSTA